MYRRTSLLALAPLAALGVAPGASADSVPYWVTDTMAYASLFSGSPDIVEERRFSDFESHVDILFAKADASAEAGYATAYAEANGSTGVLYHATFAASRADAELNGLVAGRYRVSFSYTVLAQGENPLLGNQAAVGFESGALQVELAGTGAGVHTQDIAFQECGGPVGCWIAFYAWSDSHAVDGTAAGNATISDISVLRLPDTPTLPTPLPAGLVLAGSALAVAALRARRAAAP